MADKNICEVCRREKATSLLEATSTMCRAHLVDGRPERELGEDCYRRGYYRLKGAVRELRCLFFGVHSDQDTSEGIDRTLRRVLEVPIGHDRFTRESSDAPETKP